MTQEGGVPVQVSPARRRFGRSDAGGVKVIRWFNRILVVLAIAVVVWFGVEFGRFVYAVDHPRVATHMPSHPQVPDGASDVSSSVSPLFAYFVFKVSETDFTAWTTKRGYHHRGYKRSDGSYQDLQHTLTVHIPGMIETVEITDGIWMMNRDVDGGGYTVAYDRNTGCGYLDWSTN